MGEKLGSLDLVVKLKSQNMIRNGLGEASDNGIIFPEELCEFAVSLEAEVGDGKDVVGVTMGAIVLESLEDRPEFLTTCDHKVVFGHSFGSVEDILPYVTSENG